MARSIGEIYDQMVGEKDNQAALAALAPAQDNEQQLLAALTSSSKVAVWRLYMYIISVAIHYHEVLFDLYKVEVQAIADAAEVGTGAWYQKMIYDFQLGVDLVFDTDKLKYVYETLIPSLQIVKRCAIAERSDGVLIVKAAKLVNSLPSGLDAQEQAALVSYIRKIRFAGTRFVLVSGSGDQIKIGLAIHYDPIVLISTIKETVEAAVNNYINSLPFNGVFQTSTLVDRVQAVSGVRDVVVTGVSTRYLVGGSWLPVSRVHTPNFGYYVFDTVSTNQLASTLTYLPV